MRGALAARQGKVNIRRPVRYGFKPEDLDLTYLVIQEGQALTKSDASLALLGEFKKPWSLFRVLRIVPRPIRDGICDIVAGNRLRWFGEEKDCLLPIPNSAIAS
ncbi:DCC1-like thiol-disulfide oxidoreductase family protein [uncultured Roseobacter sp.]|uniref:thiol-disulfide oxidoreductase DCC family protein n=1 Tax=uncultured Roseobacter sp. TaxID=114847 RepID=UPI00345153E6